MFTYIYLLLVTHADAKHLLFRFLKCLQNDSVLHFKCTLKCLVLLFVELLYTFDFIIQLSDVPFSVKFIIAYLCY